MSGGRGRAVSTLLSAGRVFCCGSLTSLCCTHSPHDWTGELRERTKYSAQSLHSAVRESCESAERNISRRKSGTICCRSWLSVRVMKGEIIAGPPTSVTRSVEIGAVTLHRLILPSRRQHLLWVSCETPAKLGIRASFFFFFFELSLRLILTKFDNFLTSTHKTLINEGRAEQGDRGGSHSALNR